eukprot:804591-Pelagomonas_calceolata.AAC.2
MDHQCTPNADLLILNAIIYYKGAFGLMHREGWAHTCSNGKTNNSSHKMRMRDVQSGTMTPIKKDEGQWITKLEESASLQNGMAAVRGTCSAYGCSELALNLSIHGRFSKDSLAQGNPGSRQEEGYCSTAAGSVCSAGSGMAGSCAPTDDLRNSAANEAPTDAQFEHGDMNGRAAPWRSTADQRHSTATESPIAGLRHYSK